MAIDPKMVGASDSLKKSIREIDSFLEGGQAQGKPGYLREELHEKPPT